MRRPTHIVNDVTVALIDALSADKGFVCPRVTVRTIHTTFLAYLSARARSKDADDKAATERGDF